MNESRQMPEKSQQEREIEAMRNLLEHWPQGLELSNSTIFEYAKRMNATISQQIGPSLHADGWYIHLPDGKSEKIKDENDAANPPIIYRNYYSNGETISHSVYPRGLGIQPEILINRYND